MTPKNKILSAYFIMSVTNFDESKSKRLRTSLNYKIGNKLNGVVPSTNRT